MNNINSSLITNGITGKVTNEIAGGVIGKSTKKNYFSNDPSCFNCPFVL